MRMLPITESARFFVKDGVLLPIEANCYHVDETGYQTFLEESRRSAFAKVCSVLRSKTPQPNAIHHPLLGPIGVFFGTPRIGLQHIVEERKEAHERTPSLNPVAEEALVRIVRAAVYGKPVMPMPNSPKSNTPRISLVFENYQVVVDPFWVNTSIALPTEANPSWIVTAYQMEARRQTEMESWLADPRAEVPIKRTMRPK